MISGRNRMMLLLPILMFIASLIDCHDILFKNQYSKQIKYIRSDLFHGEIVRFDSLKEPYKFGNGRSPNNYYSIILYEDKENNVCETKIIRSKNDYLGRKVTFINRYTGMDVRNVYEFPYLDVGSWLLVYIMPFVDLIILILFIYKFYWYYDVGM